MQGRGGPNEEMAEMTPDEAREMREAHDEYVRGLNRKTRAALASVYRQELARMGTSLLSGGPASKDELISAITELRYPLRSLNESIHVLHHKPDETWSACEHCTLADEPGVPSFSLNAPGIKAQHFTPDSVNPYPLCGFMSDDESMVSGHDAVTCRDCLAAMEGE